MTEENKYVVLARKYRPQSFNELLGQDALVQTLSNAIKNNRLHHAYILTGIRGVGKTTTARIIAKALNCIGKDAHEGPTINPCGICENCKAISESRHIDVLELDAASRTGVDDMREILDGVRYKPTNGRYKIYIIDEVHMLSKSAFNALLKTLEEPPSHVIFIFATTEIRKVPITVLSRCQRFDLQRLSIETLINHFKNIINNENLSAEDEALHLIAKAADGSCRDGLSLLDQAISLGGGIVKNDVVKDMIGLADKGQVFDLFETLVSGKVTETIEILSTMYKNGATPLVTLQDLISLTHLVAKVKMVPNFADSSSLSEAEKDFCKKLAPQTPIAILSKIWQMMIKGVSELSLAPVQIDALEMILIRIAYSATLPTPLEVLNDVKKNSNLSNFASPNQILSIKKAEHNSSNGIVFSSPIDLVHYLEETKKILMAYSLKNDVSFNDFADGKMKITVSEKINNDFLINLQNILTDATGKKWDIEIQRGHLGETIADKEQALDNANKKNVSDLPLVKAILAEFKGAKIETLVRKMMEQQDNITASDFEENYNYLEEEN